MSNNPSFRKRLLISALAAAAAISLSFTGCDGVFKKQESVSRQSQTSAADKETAKSKFGDNIAVKSENYTMSLPMFSYSFNNIIQYFTAYYGYDATKSSKEQFYDEENGITWYDTFMDNTKNEIKRLFTLCESARKEGVSLDDIDTQNIENNLSTMHSAAESAGQSFDEYLAKNLGDNVTEDDVRKYLEENFLAQKYYRQLYNSFQYTDEEYENTYNGNKEAYQYVDFLLFSFGYGTMESSDSSVVIDEEQKAKAKAAADELAKCKTQDEFKEYVTKYLNENRDYVNISSENSDGSAPTEEDYQKAIASQVDSVLNEKYPYEATSDEGKWLFDTGRKVNDTYISESTSSYGVIMVTKTAYRDESINRNVRHILFTAGTDGSDAEAKKKAEEVYEEWKKGEATEDSFAKLAEKYNAESDTGSAANGGLYEDVYRGQKVPEFNDWLFDENRKVGDTEIVKTDYGYHIMYYVGESMPVWKSSVDSVLRRSDISEKYAELEKNVTVEFDDDYIYTIPDPTEKAENDDENSESASSQESTSASSADESKADESKSE